MAVRKTILQQLIEQDGVEIPPGDGAERSIACLSKHHIDKGESMIVDIARGQFRCLVCNIDGGAYRYLRDIRGWNIKASDKLLRRMGASDKAVLLAMEQEADRERQRKQTLRVTDKPYSDIKGAELVSEHDYRAADGRLISKVCRYQKRHGQTTPKKFVIYSPRPGGGLYVCGPKNGRLPVEVRADKYPLYRLPQLAELTRAESVRPDAAKKQIWIVEGEKCADAVAGCKNPQGNAPPVTTPFCGRQYPIDQHDWAPLYGQRVLVIADRDQGGRKWAKDIGLMLARATCEVRYVLPPGNDHFDIADAIAQGGWQSLIDWVKESGDVLQHKDVHKNPDTDPHPEGAMEETPYFRVLGFTEGDQVLIQSKITNRMHFIRASALQSEGNLLHIAPLAFWQAMTATGSISPRHRAVWADALLRAAEKGGTVGIASKRMWGRGAARNLTGNIVYNIGNALLIEGDDGMLSESQSLSEDPNSDDIYLPGPAIKIRDNDLAGQWAAELFDAVCGYRFESENHARAFMGWIGAALIGGCLAFRPMIWMTAPATTGKTYLLDKVLKPLLGDTISDLGGASEAGIASMLESSALPVTLDEFEPETGTKEKHEAIMGLVRIATSGDSARVRGTASGGFSLTRPRFSLFVASVNKPRLNPAMESRFIPIRLSRRSVANWPKVRDAIERTTTPDRCLAVRTRIIRMTKYLAETARNLEDEFLESGSRSTRQAQQLAALTAGTAGFRERMDSVFTVEATDWHTVSDYYGPMSELFASHVRTVGGANITLAEALNYGYFASDGWTYIPNYHDGDAKQQECRDIAQRFGFRFVDADTLWVAPSWPGLRKLLRNTPYQEVDMNEYIMRLPGAERPKTPSGAAVRMKSGGVSKPVVSLPRSTLVEIGLFTTMEE